MFATILGHIFINCSRKQFQNVDSLGGNIVATALAVHRTLVCLFFVNQVNMAKWQRSLRDSELEDELSQMFGIDDPDNSEDEFETESENITDRDLRNLLTGFDDIPFCQEVENFNESNEPVLHASTSRTEDHQIAGPSSTEYSANRRRRRSVLSPLQESSTSYKDPISDTDSSDNEEEEWKKVIWPQTPDIDSFDSVKLEPKQFLPSNTRPATYFSMFFDENVITHIIAQTNLYAEQKRSRGWSPVDSREIKAFLGIIILMGLKPEPSIDLYWSTDPFFRVDEIASVMPVKRFKKILENLHLNDNSKMPPRGAPNYDKLFKIRPLLDALNRACQKLAKNTTSQSIDESMIRFKGVSSLKQFMPLKPIKRGYKVWVRADSKTGYVYEFDIYTGKRDDHTTEVGLGGNVVKSLTQKLIAEGFQGHVTFDNFFASYEIMQYLFDNGVYATATVKNRSDLPLLFKNNRKGNKNSSNKIKLDRGDMKWRTKKNVSYVMWQDTKAVSF